MRAFREAVEAGDLDAATALLADEEGRIGELSVFVRPASGLMALGAEMGARLQT